MIKWPRLTDRDWPRDIPHDYLVALQESGVDTLKATALVSVVLGLMRRVEELENRIKSMPINWS